MSGEAPVAIPAAVLAEVFAEARRAFPDECCGWLVGDAGGAAVDRVRGCANAQAGGEHPTQPGRGAETAYVIAGADLLELARSLDGPRPARVIYHSHPNGRAYFSATDREVATSPWGDGPAYPVQHLVVGIDARRVTEAALFAWSDDAAGWVELARLPGEGEDP
jgi:[CysO sulfur-carrier protein]-S-L-cysteine hydrolase